MRQAARTRHPGSGVVALSSRGQGAFAAYLAPGVPVGVGAWGLQGTRTVSVAGQGFGSAATAQNATGYYTGPTLDGAALTWPGFTVVAALRVPASLTDDIGHPIAAICPTTSYYGVCGLILAAAAGSYRQVFFRAGDNTSFLTLAGYGAYLGTYGFQFGDDLVVVASFNKTRMRLQVRNVRTGTIAQASATHAYGWRAGTHKTNIGGYDYNSGQMGTGPLSMCTILPRDVGDAAQLELVRNPWLLFAPIERRIRVPSAALPHLTLTPDGTLQQKPSPAGSDRKLYLTSAGAIEAKTAAGGGDRRISAATGTWTAH